MKLESMVPFSTDLARIFLKYFGLLLLFLSLGTITYGSEAEFHPKSCMTVRTLKESLSHEFGKPHELAKYRRIFRKHGLVTGTTSMDSLAELADPDDSESLGVSFGSIKLRDYPIILGDNPSVSHGVPISIEWDHQHESEVDLDEYEAKRSNRRLGNQLVIPHMAREDLVKKNNYSRREIIAAIKEVQEAKLARLQTIDRLYDADRQEKWENLSRSICNFLGRKKKAQERKMIEASRKIDRERSLVAESVARKQAEELEKLVNDIRDGTIFSDGTYCDDQDDLEDGEYLDF